MSRRCSGRLVDLIRDLLVEVARTGDLRDDLDPENLANYCLHALATAGTLPSPAAVRRLVTVTLAGLRREVTRGVAIVRLVVTVRSWRWERMLLVVLLALGVLAMHATPAVTAATTAESVTSPMSPPAAAMMSPPAAPMMSPPAAPMMSGLDRPGHKQQPAGHGSGPGAQHVLAACLAILGALVLAAALVVLALRHRARDAGVARVAAAVIAIAPRPPPAHAVRLAQLCVLRN